MLLPSGSAPWSPQRRLRLASLLPLQTHRDTKRGWSELAEKQHHDRNHQDPRYPAVLRQLQPHHQGAHPDVRVDPWECYQDTWQTTCSVLEHHRDLMKRVTGCILSNVNTPSMTPVIGQPQNESPQPIYQNSNISNKPTAAKILGKMGESLSRICCVRPPMERFTFVDENANLGTVMRYEEIELRILLLCGSDLLESFCIPGLWNESDMEVIVGDFGIVVVPRDGTDTDRIMNHSSILRKYKVSNFAQHRHSLHRGWDWVRLAWLCLPPPVSYCAMMPLWGRPMGRVSWLCSGSYKAFPPHHFHKAAPIPAKLPASAFRETFIPVHRTSMRPVCHLRLQHT
uniref:Nicotinamide nucleotide adenylyltransferase 2 n=1 Tax=Chrysemys picta bellii TaxID=8478 RepID=A0A8C3HQK3_CHRPI